MRQVWIISEGSPGHLSQSVGLCEALARRVELETQVLECRPRLSGLARSAVRAWMGKQGRPLPRWMMRHGLRVSLPPAQAKPDLILASGGKSVFAARSLAAHTAAPLVFLGERKPYPSEWFHTVFTPSALEHGGNDVSIELIPTRITAAGVTEAARAWRERPAGRLWAMIIGGATVSHQYAERDWSALAEGMNRLAREHRIRWLLTTSRRTGRVVESHLRSLIDPEALGAAVWWVERPEKKVAAFLGAAETVFVTQDSVTMATEAVASGKPVVLLRPELVSFSAASFLPGYFQNLEQHHRIVRRTLQQFAEFSPKAHRFSPITASVVDELAAQLLVRLSWPEATRVKFPAHSIASSKP